MNEAVTTGEAIAALLGLILLIWLIRRNNRPRRDPRTGKTLPSSSCTLPPTGWYCTRTPGHEGPCAAHPAEKFAP